MPQSLRAYGRHRQERGLAGGSAVAVSRAIATGRLKESVTYVGTVAKVTDFAKADAEWAANTDHSRAPGEVKVKSEGVTAAGVTPPAVTPPDVTPRKEPSKRSAHGRTLLEASAREKNAKADIAELEYQEKIGTLVSAAEVERAWGDMVAQMRTSILSVPSKAKGLLPHLTHQDLAQLNDLLCQQLEALALPASSKGAAA